MFLKTQSAEDRLRTWREVRQRSYNNVEELLEEFASIKPVSRYLDYYTPKSWPNPFEIVSEGYLCQSGITLILTATLINKGFITSDNLRFLGISNNISGADGLVLFDDGKAYNFLPGEVVTEQYALNNSVQFTKHIVPKDQLFA